MEEDPEKVLKSTIPRFTSFQPRREITSLEQENTNAVNKTGRRTSEKKDRHDAEASQTRSWGRNHDRHDRKKKTEAHPSACGPASQPYDYHSSFRPDIRNIDTDDVGHFVEDRKRDEDNIKYAAPNRYTVPRYREAGRHGLLGLSRRFRTTAELEPGRRNVTTKSPEREGRHGAKVLRRVLLKDSDLSRVVGQEAEDVEVDARKDYLPLSLHRSRKRRKLSDLDPSADRNSRPAQDENTGHNFDTTGDGQDLASLHTSSDSESQPEPEQASASPFVRSARERHIQLSRCVNEVPTDVASWLALIQHQDLMVALDDDGLNRVTSSAQKRGMTDVKLSMYQKALSKTRGSALQDRLVYGMMSEGAKLWDTKKLEKEWASVIKEYPSSLNLWVKYLGFRQSSSVSFTYESCRDTFKACLDQIATMQASADTERTRIYVFLRMTTFMREAGFSELAHALWQAILEYCFLEPASDQTSNELFSFEYFWDSEVARLGEEGAQGWKSSQRVEIESRSDPPLLPNTDGKLIDNWHTSEQHRMRTSIFPARTMDQVDEDDPYRMILFSDIQPYLFRPSGMEARKQLLEAFICFCDLPPLRMESWSDQSLSEDAFLNTTFLDPSHISLDGWFIAPDCHDPFGLPMPSFVICTQSLYAESGHWFSPWKGSQSVLSNKIRQSWSQRSLRQLLISFPDDDLLAEYLLALQSQVDIKEARKTAKSLLRQHSSIRLYNAFTLLEWKAGNIEPAERVWSTALSMRSSFSEKSQADIILIWRSWLWALLDRQEFSKALRLCLAVPEEKVTLDDLGQSGIAYLEGHQTIRLRAQQYLVSHLDQNLSLKKPDLSIHYLDVLTIFTYLTSSHALAPSLKQYTTTSAHPTINQSSTTLCLLHQSRARLLHLHSQTSPSGFRPSDITTPLAESIHLFPSNTIFLSLYHFHTRRSLVTDRIRDVIPTLIASSPTTSTTTSPSNPTGSIIPSLFQIYTELNRPTFAGSTSHSIRAAFEKAVSSPIDSDSKLNSNSNSAHSPTIWKLYILWEMHVASKQAADNTTITTTVAPGSEQRSRNGNKAKAKEKENLTEKVISVSHRALRACPWAKELYMLAAGISISTTLSGENQRGVTDKEKDEEGKAKDEGEITRRAVYETMVEKGLRLHLELDTQNGDFRSPTG